MLTVGHPDSFAFNIGSGDNRGVRVIDVLVGGINVCSDDNSAYVPQFRESLEVDLLRLKQFDSAKYRERISIQ